MSGTSRSGHSGLLSPVSVESITHRPKGPALNATAFAKATALEKASSYFVRNPDRRGCSASA